MTLRWLKPPITPVYSKIIVFLGEVGFLRTKTTSTITISDKLVIPPQIKVIKIPEYVGMDHGWIIPNQIRHKIATTKPTIQFLVSKVGGTRNHTTFTITICNTKLTILT